jgi:formylglycine-generating enzyme required for sulfatase activity
VTIQAGTFEMGSPASESCRESGKFKETLHTVTLTRAFDIPTTEVSQGQFEDRLGYNPSHFAECGTDCPVDGVSWSEAAAYCNALSREDGLTECYQCGGKEGEVFCEEATAYLSGKIYTCPGYRLPTEAEWEYSCRAGTKTGLPNGDIQECTAWDSNANNLAWYHANSGQTVHLPKQKKENAWGLHDMSGNVWEWTNDWFEEDLGSDARTDPPGPTTRTLGRVLRGGSAEVPAYLLRCASRHNYAPPDSKHRLRFHGFRCVRPPEP